MKVVLISTYELGRQPFGLASPAAWLREAGHEVVVADLACSPLPAAAVERAELVAFFLPMHTATRLFLRVVGKVQALNPQAALCGYGLYAPINEAVLRHSGVTTVLGGEFEQGLVDLAQRLSAGPVPAVSPLPMPRRQLEPVVSLGRQRFLVPDRAGLPPLGAYAQLVTAEGSRVVGYTEASRGCKHLCRHCPVVLVYNGVFRIVQAEVVLEDIRRQVAAGARHITFGDPDFLNGPGHAVAVVEALHREWPELTYDVTIKVEHLLRHSDLLGLLRQTGCAFVTSAVESLDDAVLEKLEKGHTRASFVEALRRMQEAELPLSPTFIPFTPWTTRESYHDLLHDLVELDLADQVAPIQLAIRLLITEGSRLLELEEVRRLVDPFDARALVYPWRHEDEEVDGLCHRLREAIRREERKASPRAQVLRRVWEVAEADQWNDTPRVARAAIPYLTEPWYC